MTKRKKRDPLAALKKKHPGPWKIDKISNYEKDDTPFDYRVIDAQESWICECFDRSLARAIAKLGGGK